MAQLTGQTGWGAVIDNLVVEQVGTPPTGVPEPASLALAGLGLGVAVAAASRRRQPRSA